MAVVLNVIESLVEITYLFETYSAYVVYGYI